MIRTGLTALGISLLAMAGCEGEPVTLTPEQAAAMSEVGETSSPLDFTMASIEGDDVDLSAYRGKVVLIVNVASKCGLTGQYEALEAMYREKKDDGLVILGFPANNFGGQEPGTNLEILNFCSGEYDVTFPMFSKISVKGDDAHPLYQYLTDLPEPLGGEPSWNFTKFLVDRNGNVAARFSPMTKPGSESLVAKVDELLAASAG